MRHLLGGRYGVTISSEFRVPADCKSIRMAQRTDAARSRRVLAVAFLSRAFAYLAGLIVLALAGVGATTTGVVILAAYAARTLWSLYRVLRPVRPSLADYVVDVLAPVATGLIVGHKPSSLHLLVAAQIAGAFLGLKPRVATVVGIVGAAGLAVGMVGANLERPIELTPEGYRIAETGAIWMGLTLGIVVFANLARHMWWQRRRLAETVERERTNAMLKQRFIAMVSHEFRTPLTGIRGYADLLANTRDGLTAAEIGVFASTIRDQAEHLSRLVDDVLVVMRLDAGRLPLTIAAVELAPVIATLEAGILASSGRSLSVDVPPRITVLADSDRLLQVLRNLTGERGEVRTGKGGDSCGGPGHSDSCHGVRRRPRHTGRSSRRHLFRVRPA